jgi:predicted RNA-binding Zn-ribbon protein involved in translation (DUF1610 family)
MSKLFIDETRDYYVFVCPKDGEIDIVYTEELDKPIGSYFHPSCGTECNLLELDWVL